MNSLAVSKHKLSLVDISKVYDSVTALDKINLDLNKGEILSIVGPSGCGKSTLLKIIGGIEKPSSGSVYFDGQDAKDLTSRERNVSFVFQNFSLYPHMKVLENLRFGLRDRGFKEKEISENIEATVELFNLSPFLQRFPASLSGGQQQRVAIARALVRNPSVLLMDEPFSSLDTNLKYELRLELLELHKKLNFTGLVVTHDQDDALLLGNRTFILENGQKMQFDTGLELFHNPVSVFVGRFIGEPPMNLVAATIEKNRVIFGKYSLPIPRNQDLDLVDDQLVILGLRSNSAEDFRMSPNRNATHINIKLEHAEYLGPTTRLHFSCERDQKLVEKVDPSLRKYLSLSKSNKNSYSLVVEINPHFKVKIGDELDISIDIQELYFFDPKTGKSLSSRINPQNFG